MPTLTNITAAGPQPPAPGIDTPHGPVVRFLYDPAAFFTSTWNSIADFFTAWWPVAAPSTIAALGMLAGARLALHSRHRRITADGARLIEIEVPAEVDANAAAVFWSRAHGILRPWWRRITDGQPHLCFEYRFTGSGVTIRIWVPGPVAPGVVESAIAAAWPGARTLRVDPVPVPVPGFAAVTGGRLRLAKSEALPLRTTARDGADPLAALLAAGCEVRTGETAIVQVLARPAAGRRLRAMRHGISRLRYQAAGRRGWSARTLAQSLLDELTGGVKHAAVPQSLRHDPVAAAEMRAAVSKAAGSLFECEVRYAVAAPCPAAGGAERAATRSRLRGVADCLAGAFAVHAERNWWARKPLRSPHRTLAARHLRRGDLLSVAELAACARLPLDARAFGVTRAGARSIAPAPGVPDPSSGTGVRLLGDADAGPARAVGVSIADGRRHTHLLGATGSGKSTLMGRMILDDVAARRGVVVIDPKGDLIADVLARLPEDAGRRTVLIDPTEPDHQAWPSLNVLAAGEDRQLLVDNLVGIFRRIYASSWGPRTDDLLRASCLTLLATADSSTFTVAAPTLTDVLELLTSDAHRREVTARLGRDQQVLRTFWTNYAALTDAGRVAVCAPLLNKLRAFLLRDFARATIAAPVSTIDMTRVLDGGILLVRLPKGALGEETTRLLGSFIVAATWQAASQRAKTDEDTRIDASLYVDEAANFLNLPYPLEDMLAEARAYRLSMTLAHQNLAQLTTELREGISANTRNKVFFACSPEDAHALATHVAPNLTEHDLTHLGAFQAAVRACIGGVPSPAFTMRTRPLPDHVTGRDKQIRAAARTALDKRRKALTSEAAQIPAPTASGDAFRIRA